MKHTPGPWHLADDGWQIRAADTTLIARLVESSNSDPARSRIGTAARADNGRLVAAAPGLLDACKALLAELERYCSDDTETYPDRLISLIEDRLGPAVARAEGG